MQPLNVLESGHTMTTRTSQTTVVVCTDFGFRCVAHSLRAYSYVLSYGLQYGLLSCWGFKLQHCNIVTTDGLQRGAKVSLRWRFVLNVAVVAPADASSPFVWLRWGRCASPLRVMSASSTTPMAAVVVLLTAAVFFLANTVVITRTTGKLQKSVEEAWALAAPPLTSGA